MHVHSIMGEVLAFRVATEKLSHIIWGGRVAMEAVSEEIPCNFVGEFKVGDNLVFNADLLSSLVEADQDGRFSKLIVIQAGAIVETALGQIIYRAQNHTREGVPEMSEQDRSAIEGKKADNFNNIIEVMKKHKRSHYAGSKGIGRFSSDRLGQELTLQTRPKGRSNPSIYDLILNEQLPFVSGLGLDLLVPRDLAGRSDRYCEVVSLVTEGIYQLCKR